MHELGMASRMLSEVLDRARGAKLRRITLCVGPLSGVSRESLRFCMDLALEEKDIKGVEVKTVLTPLVYVCKCGNEYLPVKPWDPCPSCGKLERQARGARDCGIESFELES